MKKHSEYSMLLTLQRIDIFYNETFSIIKIFYINFPLYLKVSLYLCPKTRHKTYTYGGFQERFSTFLPILSLEKRYSPLSKLMTRISRCSCNALSRRVPRYQSRNVSIEFRNMIRSDISIVSNHFGAVYTCSTETQKHVVSSFLWPIKSLCSFKPGDKNVPVHISHFMLQSFPLPNLY